MAEALEGAAQVAADLAAPTSEPGFYIGVAGQAWALAQAAQAAGDAGLARAARDATDLLATRLQRAGDRGWWTDQPGVLFDGGAMLHLLWAADHFDEPAWLEPAAAFGRQLISLAEPDPRGGWAWLGMSRAPHGITKGIWPNFFYGTSGVGFMLARLAEATGDDEFLAAAQQAAANVRALADHVTTDDGAEGVLVPYREPDLRQLHYIGLCQGPVGTARLFQQLHRTTGGARDADWVDLLGNGLVASGAPRQHSAGYWNVHGVCCGGAGMAAFHLARWADSGERLHLDRAVDAASYLAQAAVDPDGRGPRWVTAFNRVDPAKVRASSDWGHGAVGIAAVLAQVAAAQQGPFSVRRLPDDPFPTHTDHQL